MVLPQHLRTIALVSGEVHLELKDELTQRSLLDALETRFPMLTGTIRDRDTKARRPFVRFFACGEDISHEEGECALPVDVVRGTEPFVILGAMAGG
ncbi:MAG: MoaD/ThiS family protein [Acidimicrobiales bacterium]